ncbi:glycosyltransferase family 8 protein [Bacillus sp. JCM 19041]|uniref:glycosyltransferase family 8 protein n=1 Tax=Bacillus sp. JCM 19041 TaxID=1460637 RepID=UPI0006D0D823
MNEPIKIITLSDNRYVQHLGVMFASLINNKASNTTLTISVMSYGISSSNKEKLKHVLTHPDVAYDFVEIDPKTHQTLHTRNHISHAAYSKVNIPDLFPNANKAIFLDCDMVVKADLSPLWKMELDGYAVAAVCNPMFNRHHQLHIPKEALTFNSGVMVMNLAYMRDHHISGKVLEFLMHNSDKIDLHDQDGFNAILFNDWLPLVPKWNVQTRFFELGSNETSFLANDYEIALKSPAIIHFTTSSKPWDYFNFHPYRGEYFYYLQKTLWSEYQPVPTTKKEVIAKKVLGIFPYNVFLKVRRTAHKLNVKV